MKYLLKIIFKYYRYEFLRNNKKLHPLIFKKILKEIGWGEIYKVLIRLIVTSVLSVFLLLKSSLKSMEY